MESPSATISSELPRPREPSRRAWLTVTIMVALCLAGLSLRLWIGWYKGNLGDLQCWQMWGLDPGELVPQDIYFDFKPQPKNYPPLYASVVRIMRWLYRDLGLPGRYAVPMEYYYHQSPDAWRPLILYLKLPPILADIGAAWVLWGLARCLGRPEMGLKLAGFYLFSPVILYDGAYYGQTDTLLLLLLFAALWAYFAQRPIWLGAMLMAAALTKAQCVFALPVFAALIVGRWPAWRSRLARIGLGACISLAAVALLAWWTGELPQFYQGYAGIIGAYPLVSVRAFNLWWLLLRPWERAPMHYDLPRDDIHVLGPIMYRHIGEALFAIAMVLILWRLHRARYRPCAVVLALVAAGWAFFNLCTQMHERYSVPAVGLMTLLLLWESRWFAWTLVTSFTAMFNISVVCPFLFPPSPKVTRLVNHFIYAEEHMMWALFAVIHVLILVVVGEALWPAGLKAAFIEKDLPVKRPGMD